MPLRSAFLLLPFAFGYLRFASILLLPALLPAAPKASDVAPSLVAADGLEAQLWAATPLIHNPISLDCDERGRLWVAEGVNYRDFRNKVKGRLWREKGDRIVILEDTTGDGRADSSKIFLENDPDVIAPNGVSVIGDKVVVACSPNLIVYTRDAEDRVVKKEILLTGFGGRDHDHSLHKVQAGPDGRWYFNVGNAGPHIVSDKSGWTLRAGSTYTGGSPYNKKNTPGLKSDDGRIYTSGVMLSVNPDGTDLKVLGMGTRNPFGSCVDSFGNVWANDNDDTFSCRTSFWMRYGNFGFASRDGTRTWKADRRPGQDTRTAHWRQEDPGVIPAGHVYGNGAPTGITYYETGSLGESYDGGLLLSCEAGQNVIWGYKRKPVGAGFALESFPFLASTADQKKTFTSNGSPTDIKKWFRPSDITIGTDGAVYVSDWFDPGVGGHRMSDLKAEGAIYRVVAKGTNPRPPDYGKVTFQQIAILASPASNVRNSAFEFLTSIEDPSGFAKKFSDLETAKKWRGTNPRFLRGRALWIAGGLDPDFTVSALDDPDPEFRILALRVLEQRNCSQFLTAVKNLTSDRSPAVLRELCLSVRDEKKETRLDVVSAAVAIYINSEKPDPWLLEAIGTASENIEAETYANLHEKFGAPEAEWTDRFANLAWRLHPKIAIPAFKQRALLKSLPEPTRKRAIDSLAFVEDKAAAEAMFEIATGGLEDLRPYAAYWIRHRETHHWEGAGFTAKLPEAAESPEAFGARLVAEFKNNKTTDARRLAIAKEMTRQPAAALQFTTLLRWKKLSPKIEKEIIPLLLANPDPAVAAAIAKIRPGALKAAGTYTAIDVLKLNGDPTRGKALYFGAGTCFTCHTHSGEGREVGPDMTKIHEKFDRAALVDSIINPSAAILVGYEATHLKTKDGAVHLGFVDAESETRLTLRDIAGQTHPIKKSEIAERENLKSSLMPPMSSILTPQQIADLTTFLSLK